MYSKGISELREKWSYKNIALCKETLSVWKKLGLDYRAIKCNCIWWCNTDWVSTSPDWPDYVRPTKLYENLGSGNELFWAEIGVAFYIS